jgi:hypothetical protein
VCVFHGGVEVARHRRTSEPYAKVIDATPPSLTPRMRYPTTILITRSAQH